MGQETRERALEVRCPVTVPREVGSLSRMKDDRTNIIVSQQRRDLVFGDWTSATIFVPRQVLFRGARGLSRPDRRHRKLLVAIGEGAGGADAGPFHLIVDGATKAFDMSISGRPRIEAGCRHVQWRTIPTYNCT